MLLISSAWDGQPTFKMIPASQDAPYNEVIFDPTSKALAIVGKEKKQTLHMLPKLTETGDVQILKLNKRMNGKDFAEQRVSMETFYEYFIENKDEILEFVSTFAINASKSDYATIVENAFTEKPTSILPGPQIITEL
jgi:hypothetical protein